LPTGFLRGGDEDGLSKLEVMGAEVAAGGGRLPGFLGRKSRYARMDDVLPPEPEDGGGVRVRGSSSRRYVFACSVFASLNHVLLGYGEILLLQWRFLMQIWLYLFRQLGLGLEGCVDFSSLQNGCALS